VLESVPVPTDPTAVRSPVRLAVWVAFVFLFAAVAYGARFAGTDTPDDLAYRYTSSAAALAQYGLILAILLLITWGLPRRQVLALRRPASVPRALGLTALALLAIWAASGALAPFLDATDEQGLVPKEWDSSRAAAFFAFFAVVTVVAPAVEELTYRGVGFALLSPYGKWAAVVATAVLFGLAHGLVAGLPVLTIFGLAVGWLRARTASVYPGMLLHGVFNGAALVVSVTV
jgi:membrane protease YdiL (CAAX protease family)